MSYIISTTAGAVLIMQLTQQNGQMLLGGAVWVKFNICMCHRMGKAATHISAVELQYKYKYKSTHKRTYKSKYK